MTVPPSFFFRNKLALTNVLFSDTRCQINRTLRLPRHDIVASTRAKGDCASRRVRGELNYMKIKNYLFKVSFLYSLKVTVC